ncbi:hypothetical protein FOL47_001445 [Perkinsus chesapeaki]|uniref:folate gamma-glutamyl hydrolase n=1 Tax=Perkinsus chesapeaki TaxID=330153 RepID=A0A7J6MJ48_PERCH|nr:hypothetical protein FOL47_001445 [Perkinsus chesapeaki]
MTMVFAGNLRNDLVPSSPVVGVLAHPPVEQVDETFVMEYVVEFLESAGIQVVPLLYDDPYLESQLQLISGVYLPDGNVDVTLDHPYVKAANAIYKYALKRHSEQDPFPLLGMCQGHQILAALAAGTADVIAKKAYTTTDVALSLNINGDGGEMLGSLPPNVRQILENKPVTANLHSDGVPPEMWDDLEGSS